MSLAEALRLRERAGFENAFDIPGFVPEYVRPSVKAMDCSAWGALAEDPDDIFVTDRIGLDICAHDESLCRWIRMARERVRTMCESR